MPLENKTIHLFLAIATLTVSLSTPAIASAEAATGGEVTIHTDFPGGNVVVSRNDGSAVHVAPDPRGDSPWFYWYFEAKAAKPGRVNFVFPEQVAGFKNGAIGFQGPAISMDLGKTWKWMGTESVAGSSFYFDFAKTDEPVRFAVTIPYLQQELDAILDKNAGNSHLKTSILTKSRHGRNVELLQIGEPGPDVKPVLVTGRHHATETIASYVLDGFLQEAMSDSPAGEEFRKKYVLYAVPFVDKDGVEEGDQGKNRKPHDHNRDYGEASIYPEIQAIKELDKAHRFQLTLDFHCPTLVMQDHQVMYFVGAKEHPQHNFENVSELASWIKKGLPENAPHGPLVWLRSATEPTPMNSHYFGFKADAIMAATLEIPFAPPGKATDPASCRQYGQVILQAWVNTHFRQADEAD
ncbi:MAG: M14 family zinc carboxypeptidase [Planctomycetota bacterium]